MGRFVPALVPIGFAMWFAHMFFHFVTSAGAIVPVVQRLIGVAQPAWGMGHSMSGPDWLVPAQITALGLGLVFSVAAAWLVAMNLTARPARAAWLAAPWVLIATMLYVAGIWIVFQPMEMRGTMMMMG